MRLELIMLIPISIIFSYSLISLYNVLIREKLVAKAIEKGLEESSIEYFSKSRIQKFLDSRGIDYLNPTTFIIIKIFLTIMFGYVSFVGFNNTLITIFSSIIGFFSLDLTLEISNLDDNKKFASDIVRIFDIIKSQVQGGVYITDALRLSYKVARNKRLKKALKQLSNDLALTNDFEYSISRFNSRFKCKNINKFCLVIKQGVNSGKVYRILEDSSVSMKEIEMIVQREDSKKVEQMTMIIQILIYAGVLLVVGYGLMGQLTTGVKSF